ncbi:hypothetical protein EJ06DRAFT_522411 [Trichodelitschia bisporula]|uniref:DUF7729 domain-containing protein n=1 Tax=Trichodelitschia bisporula TaxID=703511 RepID=A0A6G1HUD4_9PEZI|nr:hypothetical protein EJ06DRAFT_522411 [Trichodelitschia bisporula]
MITVGQQRLGPFSSCRRSAAEQPLESAAPYHNIHPGRRKPAASCRHRTSTTWRLAIAFLLSLALLCSTASAQVHHQHPSLQKLARKSELLYDHSKPPVPLLRRALIERQEEEIVAATTEAAAATSEIPTPSFTLVSSTDVAAAATATADAGIKSSSLPQPFDTSLGSNFTSTGCPTFFQKMLSDNQFQKCYPLSLLLQQQTSHNFFEAQKSFVRTTFALDAGCNANFARCNALMGSLATKLRSSDSCAADYTNQNPLVMQAYSGLIAYATMYQAGCLKDDKGNYCFANAITLTNTTSLADAYPYYLALGTDLPGAVRPTCSNCLKNTMSIFAGAAGNQSQPISHTYRPAAEQINMGCGPGWVQESVALGSKKNAVTGSAHGSVLRSVIPLGIGLLLWGIMV